MSFKVGDTILYGTHGVCRIAEISERDFGEKGMKYYILKPIGDEKATLFVPVNNEKLTDKMRRVLTSAEIYELIKAMPAEDADWIANESTRKEKYKEILTSGNRMDLIQMVKTLYTHQSEQKENGKKLHISDDRFMKDAERMLYAEIAHVLDMEYEEVLPFILEELNVDERWQA